MAIILDPENISSFVNASHSTHLPFFDGFDFPG